MISRQTGQTMYAIVLVALGVALVASAVRAQSAGFYARRAEIQKQAKADRDQAQLNGDANRKRLYQLYPTPEIPLAKAVQMAPGSTAPLSIVGKFSDKTTFVSATEGVELTDAVVAANSFKATVSSAAGLSPRWGRIYAFAPVSGAETWTPAVLVGAPRAFSLTAKNGWTIKLSPSAPAFKIPDPGTATATYKAEFFKAGAATPFETTTGTLTIEAESDPNANTFMMQQGNSGSAMAEVMELSTKMGELMKAGKFSGPEMTALQKKLEVAQDRLVKEADAQMKDPGPAQKKQDDFGCGTLNLFYGKGGISGNVNCGKNVGSLDFTGK